MITTITKKTSVNRQWHLIDLKGQTLGRASTHIAELLMGKGKTYYAPNVDCGDYVVVVNSAAVKVTGQKQTDKLYRHHTGHPGGFRELTFTQVAAKDPTEIIRHSVSGMLPKNKLRDPRLKRLKLYEGVSHPYADKLS